MKVLGVIPARKGSKGIKRKNIKQLYDKPLIDFTFELVDSLSNIDEIFLTTDDEDVIELSGKYNRIKSPFKRPASLSKDTTSMAEVVDHLLKYLINIDKTFDYIVLFQPTTPFRSASEIEGMINFTIDNKLDSCVAVSPVWHHPSEYISIKNKKIDYILDPSTAKRRQDYKKIYFITGAAYVAKWSFFIREKAFFNKESSTYELSESSMIDIDTDFNFNIAEGYLRQLRSKNIFEYK